MTMQTFIVLFLGISFGYKVGVISVVFYLIEGIMGLPVFSNSPEKGIGLAYFVGPTMGYLIGFIFACLIAGIFTYDKNHILNFLKIIEDIAKPNTLSPKNSNLSKSLVSLLNFFLFSETSTLIFLISFCIDIYFFKIYF